MWLAARYRGTFGLWSAALLLGVSGGCDDEDGRPATADVSDTQAADAAGDFGRDLAGDADPDGADAAGDAEDAEDGDGAVEDLATDEGPDAPPDAPNEDGSEADAADAADTVDSGDAPDDVADGGADGPPDDTTEACTYPVIWLPDPTAQAAAEAALATLAPDTTASWHAERGTFQTLFNLNLPLVCADASNAWEPILDLVEANPAVFQLDMSEWEDPVSFPCSIIDDVSNTTVNLGRRQLGTEGVARDVIAFSLRRVDEEVQLRSFIGTYLPSPPEAVMAAMLDCGGLSAAEARAAVDNTTFPFTTFNLCAPTGSGEYAADEQDTVELDEAALWSWTEDAEAGGVSLTKEHLGRLIIHPDNVTETLEDSDANCPDESGDERVYGFRIVFDAVLATILSKLPGIGCIVC